MRPGLRLRAVALGVLLVSVALPAAAAPGELPDLGPNVTVARLAGGGTSIVRPAQGAPVAAVELWYRAPSVGFGAKPQPSLARLAAQVVAASKPVVGDPLGKVVDDTGGRLAITVYSDSVAVTAVVPATSARQVVRAMTTAFFAPVVTEDGFRFAQRDLAQQALVSSFDPETVVRDAIFGQLFASGPQHFPSLGAAKDVPAIALDDVRSFATRAFRAPNAILIVSGAVEPNVTGAAVTGRTNESTEPEAPAAPEIAASPGPVSKDFVQRSGGYGWVGPPIANQREATAMDFVADYLFRPQDGSVSKVVADKYPDALMVGQFITLRDPGVMFVAYSGKELEGIRGAVDSGFEGLRQPLGATAFAAGLTSFKYHLLSDLQTPTQLADNFGWYSVEGSPSYAPGAGGESGAYFKAADSLTPDFVASVVAKYLAKPPVVVTLRPREQPPKAKVE